MRSKYIKIIIKIGYGELQNVIPYRIWNYSPFGEPLAVNVALRY